MAVQMLASTPLLVTVLNAILVAAIVALLALQVGAATITALVAGGIGFVITIAIFTWYANRDIQRVIEAHAPLFPAQETEPGA